MSAALRVAIVGAGPSGLYAAAELLKRHASAQVEMFDLVGARLDLHSATDNNPLFGGADALACA